MSDTPLTASAGTVPLSATRTHEPIQPRAVGDIECWGHRGASAHLPENTLASFRAAIAEGAQGIESDVHATLDGVILMFHDPTLDRTTTGSGLIRTQPWKGVIENVRTTKEPVQPIPRFQELIDLLMEPAHHHVLLNIDCKMQNDPEKLFANDQPEMARIIAQHENWQTLLAPRLVLGLWHPLFIKSAYAHLPLLKRYNITWSLSVAKQYFWDSSDGFSCNFAILMGPQGQQFMDECRAAGKEVCVWTVNDKDEIKTAMAWGVQAILTDRVGFYDEVRKEVLADPSKLAIQGYRYYTFPWANWKYYSAAHLWFTRTFVDVMRDQCYQPGPFEKPDITEFSMSQTVPPGSNPRH